MKRRVLDSIADQAPHFDRIGLDIGYVYRCGALISHDRASDTDDAVTTYVPSTRVGARFPHLWLDSTETRSSHDALRADGYTLLLDDEGGAWKEAAQTLDPLQTRLHVETMSELGEGDEGADALRRICGVGRDGALLIRPDGHVAWREPSLTENPIQTLRRVFERCFIR